VRRSVPRPLLALLGCCAVGAVACAAAPAPTRPVPVASETPVASATPDPSDCPMTAAQRNGWGEPARSTDFAGAALPPDWHPYGPEPGHDGKGVRTPAAITVGDGSATIAGTAGGTTGAMSWHPGQRYGRWEACVRVDPGPDGYHAVLILWPVAEDFPAGGEIDWMEIFRGDRQEVTVNIHHGPPDRSFGGAVEHDTTRWTAWAVEWTPQHITTYVDGEQWYSTTRSDLFPPRPMNMTAQLDWFPPADGGSAMHVDWARQWALPESEPATLSLAPGDPATGQPRLHPDRAPRPLPAPP
jgi:licheninase